MSIIDHATTELEIAGLFDNDSDYNGAIGEAVMELIEAVSYTHLTLPTTSRV